MSETASFHHLTLATTTRLPGFPDEQRLRAAVRAQARVAGPRLRLFAVVDDHAHAVARASAAEAGRLGRALRLSLGALSPEPIAPARVTPVEDRNHLESLVRYCLVQPSKHGIAVHPATWTGSCFPDLVGARRLAGFELAITTALPRFRTRSAYAHVGLPELRIGPAADAVLRGVGPQKLAALAAEAFGAGPELGARDLLSVRVREVVVKLGHEIGLRTGDVAEVLSLTPRGVQLALARDVGPGHRADARAVRTRVALDLAVAVAGPRAPVPVALHGSGRGRAPGPGARRGA